MRVAKASSDKRTADVGANLFIGNLDPDIDEKLLYDTFTAFGGVVDAPRVMRDPETGNSKGFGFVKYETFEAFRYNGRFSYVPYFAASFQIARFKCHPNSEFSGDTKDTSGDVRTRLL